MAKRAAMWIVRFCASVGVLLVAGFLWFANIIDPDAGAYEKADGIVALTGGGFRIVEGYRLLQTGLGKRLLITGVNKIAKRHEIKKLIPTRVDLFDCCVDLDRRALNTIGNAEETAKWVKKHGFRSIIVVTASYHMPRSLTELRRAMPSVSLLPHAVTPKNFHAKDWWRYPGTCRILAWEYVKYIAAVARLGTARIWQGIYGKTS